MPAIIIFQRRWNFGSDDLVIPGVTFFMLHAMWLIILAIFFDVVERSKDCAMNVIQSCCYWDLQCQLFYYSVIFSMCCIIETSIAHVAMRGTIFNPSQRLMINYLLYIRLCLLVIEFVISVFGVIWLIKNHLTSSNTGKLVLLAIIVSNWVEIMSVGFTVWCTFDPAGRVWVKNHQIFNKEVSEAYQNIWYKRLKIILYGARYSNDTIIEIANSFRDYFKDSDLVLSDIVTGILILLRKYQQTKFQESLNKNNNDNSYNYNIYNKNKINHNINKIGNSLKDVPFIPNSRLLQLSSPEDNYHFQEIVHYMDFALAIYGCPCPIHYISKSIPITRKLPSILRCCKKFQKKYKIIEMPNIIGDDHCGCDTAALLDMVPEGVKVIYISYKNEVDETPFFVAIDHFRKAIVISISGTQSQQDMATDFKAECEPIPLDAYKEDWIGHKGFILAAKTIKRKLLEEGILEEAFSTYSTNEIRHYNLVVVGHSMGAGISAILAILLKQKYPNLKCFVYSPPVVLSAPAMEYSKGFITSVIVGDDCISRWGLRQMDMFRDYLVNVLKNSNQPKWQIILSFVRYYFGLEDISGETENLLSTLKDDCIEPDAHPINSSIPLNIRPLMFPPGKILHINKHYSFKRESKLKCNEPEYYGMWVDNRDFDHFRIAPAMFEDHKPSNLRNAFQSIQNQFKN